MNKHKEWCNTFIFNKNCYKKAKNVCNNVILSANFNLQWQKCYKYTCGHKISKWYLIYWEMHYKILNLKWRPFTNLLIINWMCSPIKYYISNYKMCMLRHVHGMGIQGEMTYLCHRFILGNTTNLALWELNYFL
jgi:hypothetical protein